MKRALIVSYNKFPEGDAGSTRQFSFAKLLLSLDYEVFVIGMGDFTSDNVEYHNDLPYVSFRSNGSSKISKLSNVLLYCSRLKQHLVSNQSYNLIIVVQIPINAFIYLKKYCARRNITLLHDCVEWYSPSQFKAGFLSISFLTKEIINRFIIDKSIKVIAISKYLYDYFDKKGIQSIRIPVIMNENDFCLKHKNNINKLTFLYAGSPKNKDYLKEIIQGFCMIDKRILREICLKIIGVTTLDLIEAGVSSENISYLNDSLQIKSRLTRTEVLNEINECHFTVLLRPFSKRYSMAGFPTKVVESLFMSTPVICNLTSDLDLYLKDGVNAIVVQNCTSADFHKSIMNAIKLTENQLSFMQNEAFKTASHHFGVKNYKEIFSEFLNERRLL